MIEKFLNIDDSKLIIYNDNFNLIKKAERGTHTKLVLVHRAGKVFKRKQRVGRKEVEKVVEKYTGKLYHSTSDNNANKILNDGFDVVGKSGSPYSEYNFIYFNEDIQKTKNFGETTLEINVKDIRIGSMSEFNETINKYKKKWDKKIDASVDKFGFSSLEVKKLYHEREGKTNIMNDEIIEDFNNRFDAIRGIVGDTIITNHKLLTNVKKSIKSPLDPENMIGIKSIYDGTDITPGIHGDESFICKFKDGSSSIHKTMRNIDIIGEIGAYRTSEILGWGIVPETIKADYGNGVGSSQKWIPNTLDMYDLEDNEGIINEKYFDNLAKIFVLDMITGNNDRHNSNMIIDKNDKIWAIDNEDWGARSTKENISSLNEWSKSGEGRYVTMIRVLENSFGTDKNKYAEFQKCVYDNLDIVIENQDRIVKCWEKSVNGNNFNTTQQSLNKVVSNLEYIKAYKEDHDKNL